MNLQPLIDAGSRLVGAWAEAQEMENCWIHVGKVCGGLALLAVFVGISAFIFCAWRDLK